MANLARIESNGLAINSVQDLNQISAILAKSGFFSDAKGEAQCAVKVLAGLEMGIGAFAAMTGIHIIQGKPSAGANLMAMKVKSHPKYDYRVKQLDSQSCCVEFFEAGQSIGVSEFTIKEAQSAQVYSKKKEKFVPLTENNPNWRSYPRNMLFARAMSNGIRFYCPDVFSSSVYTPEELGAEVNQDGDVVNVESIKVEEVDQRDWKYVISELGFTAAKLRDIAIENELPASSRDLSPAQSDALFKAALIDYGVSSGVFKAKRHTENSLNKLLSFAERELFEDAETIAAWKLKIKAKAQPVPALE